MDPRQDLTIVTTASNGYGRFLDAWCTSIIALTVRPAAVRILTHGAIEDANAAVGAARRLAPVLGVQAVVHEHVEELLNVAAAKNRAVAGTRTPWVMNLDADDTLLPHALEDVAALAPQADIVAFGYERHGEVRGKVAKGSRLYADAVGLDAVRKFYPASGNWPFRRSLWQLRPYRLELEGGWDTASLIDWCHLGARVKATTRPCFRYFRRSDSVLSQRILNPEGRLTWNKAQIEALHRGGASCDAGTVTVLVPRAARERGDRQAAWRFVRRWYEQHFPDWQLVEGFSRIGMWCKGAAIEAGLQEARGATLVIADADCLLDPDALREGVAAVQEGRAPWYVPHGQVLRLERRPTLEVLAGTRDPFEVPKATDLVRPGYAGFPGGGILIVPRVVYQAAGGIPRAFVGWGAEDQALATILDRLAGKHGRGAADLVHLWHAPQARDSTRQKNQLLLRSVREAARRGREELLRYLRGGMRSPVTEPLWRVRARETADRLAREREERLLGGGA